MICAKCGKEIDVLKTIGNFGLTEVNDESDCEESRQFNASEGRLLAFFNCSCPFCGAEFSVELEGMVQVVKPSHYDEDEDEYVDDPYEYVDDEDE